MLRGAAGAVGDEDGFCQMPPTTISRAKRKYVLFEKLLDVFNVYRSGAKEDTMRTYICQHRVVTFHVHAIPPERS